jgi:hypothetical protein
MKIDWTDLISSVKYFVIIYLLIYLYIKYNNIYISINI